MSEFFTFNDIFLYNSMPSRRRKNKYNDMLVKFNSILCESGFNSKELSAQYNELVVYTYYIFMMHMIYCIIENNIK